MLAYTCIKYTRLKSTNPKFSSKEIIYHLPWIDGKPSHMGALSNVSSFFDRNRRSRMEHSSYP